ncbi:mutS protein homolog 5-like [Limulus polyphemus]|uniref:MutS protein homolog 5-like n=1 Tax=Limulus polyphemus TaxID=6850 RepID=A0ABM1RZP1_LIMPO|nr:mutS protein homolog 5-like [Limulus polyphemus]
MPSIDFSYEAAKRRLDFINLPFMPPNLTDAERHIFLSSLLDFTNVSMVRATGGLLKFLEKNRIGIQLESEDSRIPILGLSSFTLEKILWMDENTYSAFQVFTLLLALASHGFCHISYLSIVWAGGKIGAAYYDIEACQIQMFPDQSESPPDFGLVKISCTTDFETAHGFRSFNVNIQLTPNR